MKYNITSMNDVNRIDTNETNRNYFVFALGYEERSAYLAKQLMKRISCGELVPIPFIFDDHNKSNYINDLVNELDRLGFPAKPINYQQSNVIIDSVIDMLDAKLINNIYIDYSSMPRSWYCRFPQLFSLTNKCLGNITFWYAKGQYKAKSDDYPNTGILPEFDVFSGKATLRPLNERTHVFCLGYDHIRTQAIMTVIDPNIYGVVIASPSDDLQIRDNVKEKNSNIINSSTFRIELPIEDFQLMVSILSDFSNQLISKGDVILVPDGPKPLIMACSIVPEIIENYGVVCMHVKRHNKFFEPINVTATGEIYGFVLSRYES